MYVFSFVTASILMGTVIIDKLIAHSASDPTIFVSGFGFGGFCGVVLAAYYVSLRDRP